ncbi:MAG TPA: gephyrin-like molybdotransferase Glp [Thermodesulfobacteriota bacterium]|nr:gephyrin-like molybdotransferase Glp [Thermodesulfobacteriota bacterium]
MISVEAALEIILSGIKPLGMERINILSSLGRVLGEDITASTDNPPWDNSAMDGYALKAIDTKTASKNKPVILKVIEDLPAGYTAKKTIKKGEAIRIMTGAPMPKGADAVLMVEDTEKSEIRSKKSEVKIFREARLGDNIRKAGEDFRKGDIVLTKGISIRSAEIGMLAAVGKPVIYAHQRPKVAVLSTGDELVEIDETPTDGKIRNSNSYAIAAQVKIYGAIPVQLGIARDNKKDLREKLEFGLTADCIVSSGGVSVGDFDFVKDVLKEMGSDMRFWKVAMKPGKPLAFGVIGGKPAFGLPGNPISSMVAFEQFAMPAILKMMGKSEVFKRVFDALLTKPIKKKPGRVHFVRAALEQKNGQFYAAPLEGQGSGILSSMVKANCLIILPEDAKDIEKDSKVKVQMLDHGFLYQDKHGY